MKGLSCRYPVSNRKWMFLFSFDPFLHGTNFNSQDNALAQEILSENAA